MNIPTICTNIILLIGIIIMFLSIIKLIKLFKNLYKTIQPKNAGIYAYFRIHLLLLFLFLTGYVAFLVIINLDIHYVGELFVSFILLFGAIFVLIGLVLQAGLFNNMRNSNLQAIKVLVSAAEARDPYTMGHSEHVANLLGVMYTSLPWKIRKTINYDLLKYAGLLHDIGKIGVPESILNNPGQLSDAEMEIMKQHPAIGESIINHVEFLRPITKWVLYHHERIDGKGYYNLTGEKIPFISKMMTVADIYSSLVTERKYRPVKSHEEAIQILYEVAGFQLDIDVVNNFCNIDYEVIKKCTPKNQSIRILHDYNDIDEKTAEYIESLAGENILDKDTGIVCIKKYINLAHRNKELLIFNKMEIEGMREDKNIDYHIIDKINICIEDIINKRIRKSDIVSRLSRDSYLFLFQKCSKKKADEILNHIQSQVMEQKILSKYDKKINFINNFFVYNPKKEGSYDIIMNFLSVL